MKILRSIPIAAVALAVALTANANTARSKSGPNGAWEKLKTLVGEWEGTLVHGSETLPVSISYTLVSSGQALMERLTAPDGADMVTMYHPEGGRVLMTHYCSSGNQPRMRADGVKPDGSIAFRFVDVTNLASPNEEHMRALAVKFVDADHFTQEWTHRTGTKEETGVFRYSRKKSRPVS